MPFSSFGLSEVPSDATLQTPERNSVTEETSSVVKNQSIVISKQKVIENQYQDEIVTKNNFIASVTTEVLENKEIINNQKQNSTKVFIFGAVLLGVIILFLFVNKFIVSREE
jgi:membrane-associated HD superfamily phosphohydrolase